ncbi:hypothetical protein E2C01_069354 [Portunus trituberculatus]|uniref:Uncharacterized protein n=1 Tax=Portunus trituberculatus TaxID=210409 RepID=A0A5B7HPU6_PORTR|nr:hypothetical protein [Portunus trituberculatus]
MYTVYALGSLKTSQPFLTRPQHLKHFPTPHNILTQEIKEKKKEKALREANKEHSLSIMEASKPANLF